MEANRPMLTCVNRVSDKVSSSYIGRATTEYISVFVNGCRQFLMLSEGEVIKQILH